MKSASDMNREKVVIIESKYKQIFESIEDALNNKADNEIVFLCANGEYQYGIRDSIVFWDVVKVLKYYGYKIGDWPSSNTSFISNG